MKHILRLKLFFKPYLKQSFWALVLLISVVIMDLAIPRLIQRIIDQGIAHNDLRVVINTTLIMLGLTLLSATFAIGNNILSVRVGEGIGRDIRQALFQKIQAFSFGDLDRLRTGQLMVRLTSDITMIERIIRVSIRIGTRAPMLMIGSILLMVSTSFRLALAIFPLLFVTTGIIIWFISKTQPLYLIVQRKLDALNTVLQENIAGVRVVKAFSRADYETERFAGTNQDYTARSIEVMQYMAFMMPIMTFLINLGVVLVIWIGGLQAIGGSLSLGEIVAFTNYLLTTMTPLVIMSNLAQVLAAANASAERINDVLDITPQIQDQPDAVALPTKIMGKVAFEGICFSYNGDCSEPVLQDVSFVADPGETVAILGATGSGKTSLVNLIPRFYEASQGRVTIDGIDVRTISQDSLLSHVGVALQETVLFSGSVLDNIRHGDPGASLEAVYTVAKAVQAHEFILRLPQGYDTHVEQRGVNLSGGQKQRIAIARALLLKPEILILDDSTSAIDVETEAKIQDELERMVHGSTRFIVAQRISTVLDADKIVVLERGRIAAMGTHQELMRTSSIYQEIYESQLGLATPLELIGEEVSHGG